MGMVKRLAEPPFDEAVYLIDVSGFLFRFYHSVRGLSTSRREPVGAVFGVTRMIHRLVDDLHPRRLAVAMDSRTPTFRREIYSGYKADRPPPPEDLRPQFDFVREVLEAFRIPVLQRDGFEADDVLATAVARAEGRFPVVILSSDKDLHQLVSDRVLMLGPDLDEVTGPDEVRARWGVGPERMIDLQALVGDAGDSVPGVPGIGPKTAARLLADGGTLDDLLAHPDRAGSPRFQALLAQHADVARRARELVRLRRDVPLDLDFEAMTYLPPPVEVRRAVYRRFEFHSLLQALPAEPEAADGAGAPAGPPLDYAPVTDRAALEALLVRLRAAGRFAVDTETTGLDPLQAELVGISFSCEPGVGRYVPLGHTGEGADRQLDRSEVLARVGPLLADPAVAKVGQNLKFDALVLRNAGLPLGGAAFDTMLASYLLDPERHQHRLEQLAAQWLSRTMISYEQVTDKRRGHQLSFDQVAVSRAAEYSAEDAEVTFALVEPLERALDEAGLRSLLQDIEMPLAEVLGELEWTGVRVDAPRLRQLARELDEEAAASAEDIQRLAGRPFNPNSPKQLAEILFDVLALPQLKKTKTGRSTDAEVLEELAPLHPLPAKLLHYRMLTRLVSGYLEALPTLVNPRTGRIHTSYNQAVAATGRLSSSGPNLQNIPVRTEVGRRIRDAFVAEPGHRLLSFDYSQVELRVLAHLSADPLLVESFRTGEDVHARTAREVFGAIAGGTGWAELRRRAKVINFGVIYGKTDFGLARELGIPKAQARRFIDDYFARYAGVKRYLDGVVEQARREGVVRTILGRRRFLADIGSRNPAARSAAERVAMNTPIQGTAADLIKLAMIRVHRALGGAGLRARMILTVHDELVIECPLEEVARARECVREAMETAMRLDVPLVVDVGEGDTWGQAH